MARMSLAPELRTGARGCSASSIFGKGKLSYLSHSPNSHTSTAPSRVDLLVGVAIVVFGLFTFFTCSRVEIVSNDSAQYIGLAKSLADYGSYEFNFRPHTRFPPGMPLILALVQSLGSPGYFSCILTEISFSVLSLAVVFLFLRGLGHVYVGAVAVLLLASSAEFYQRAAMTVGSDFSFLFFSFASLIYARQIETSQCSRKWVLHSVTFLVLVVWTVMIRPNGLALVVALVVWVASRSARRSLTETQLWTAMPAILGGTTFYGMWAWWVSLNVAATWPGEFMNSYWAQLMLKDVHRPEMGVATASDFALRIANNAAFMGAQFAALVTHWPWIDPRVYAPAVAISLFLGLVGFLCSLRDEARVMDLYFAAYSAMLLLWPFQEGPRYLFPVFPMALLYVWQGIRWCGEQAKARPSGFRIAIAAGAGLMALASTAGSLRLLPKIGVQSVLASLCWITLLLLASTGKLWRCWTGHKFTPWVVKYAAVSALGSVVIGGVIQEGAFAKRLDGQDPSGFLHGPLTEVTKVLKPHLQIGDSVMAAHEAAVHYLTGFRCVEFPVISDAAVIKETMESHNARYLIVNLDEGRHPYFLPTQKERYLNLLQAFPGLGIVIHRQENYVVVEIASPSS